MTAIAVSTAGRHSLLAAGGFVVSSEYQSRPIPTGLSVEERVAITALRPAAVFVSEYQSWPMPASATTGPVGITGYMALVTEAVSSENQSIPLTEPDNTLLGRANTSKNPKFG